MVLRMLSAQMQFCMLVHLPAACTAQYQAPALGLGTPDLGYSKPLRHSVLQLVYPHPDPHNLQEPSKHLDSITCPAKGGLV